MIRIARLLERGSDERGFTLIELAVAIGVFGIFLVGFSFVFESSFSTSREVRFDQRAKTLAQERMEEVRALPFYVSQKTDNSDVDILDRYFPGTSNGITPTGQQGTYDGTTNVWKYTSRETVNDSAGTFDRRVIVGFVQVDGDGNMAPRPPATGYNSDNADLDRPATNAINVSVVVSWTFSGRPREVKLDTIITRTRQEEPKVEVSGSIAGAQVSGLEFNDGDDSGVAADLFAVVGAASISYREVTESTAQASARPIEVIERHPQTNSPLQQDQSQQGMASVSVPNASTGSVQAASSTMAAGTMVSVEEPLATIAGWGSASPSAVTEARVSPRHTLNPESLARVTAGAFSLNARNRGALSEHRVLDVAGTSGEVDQRSTTLDSRIVARVTLSQVVVAAAPQFTGDPDYQGTVLVDSIEVESRAQASTTTSSTMVSWSVTGLRVWDPELEDDRGRKLGGYLGPWTFGFNTTCGGWVGVRPQPGDPECGVSFENPNPIEIPQSYVGTDPSGLEGLSLSISAGATVRESVSDASTGVANASAAQKNVLSITLRNDIVGAEALEPAVIGLGDANASVSYVEHEH